MASAGGRVRVAVRVRPLLSFEKTERLGECLSCIPQSKQLCVGDGGDNGRNTFTFDFTFPTGCEQRTLYDDCVASLLEGGKGGAIAGLSRHLPPIRSVTCRVGSVLAAFVMFWDSLGVQAGPKKRGHHVEHGASLLLRSAH